jgi:hypothetical protein
MVQLPSKPGSTLNKHIIPSVVFFWQFNNSIFSLDSINHPLYVRSCAACALYIDESHFLFVCV